MQDLLPPLVWAFELLLLGLTTAGAWRTLAKAGHRGWLVLVPLVNLATLIRIAQRPVPQWFVLLAIPGVNVIALGALSIAIARRFGRGAPFGLGLAYVPFVFYPLLGFGDAACVPVKS